MAFKDVALIKGHPLLGRLAYFALGFAACFTLVSYQII